MTNLHEAFLANGDTVVMYTVYQALVIVCNIAWFIYKP